MKKKALLIPLIILASLVLLFTFYCFYESSSTLIRYFGYGALTEDVLATGILTLSTLVYFPLLAALIWVLVRECIHSAEKSCLALILITGLSISFINFIIVGCDNFINQTFSGDLEFRICFTEMIANPVLLAGSAAMTWFLSVSKEWSKRKTKVFLPLAIVLTITAIALFVLWFGYSFQTAVR